MREMEEYLLFDDESGCLTDYALRGLMDGSLEEMERLEASEHLSYCDACVERYTAMLADDLLLEAPELLKQNVLQKLRKRAAKVLVNRYFHMGVAACLTLVLWGTGVFGSVAELPRFRQEPSDPQPGISQRLGDFASGFTGGLNDFIDQLTTIDLRGAFTNEKK